MTMLSWRVTLFPHTSGGIETTLSTLSRDKFVIQVAIQKTTTRHRPVASMGKDESKEAFGKPATEDIP